MISEPFVCSILSGGEFEARAGEVDSSELGGLEVGPRDKSRREVIKARHWPNQIC